MDPRTPSSRRDGDFPPRDRNHRRTGGRRARTADAGVRRLRSRPNGTRRYVGGLPTSSLIVTLHENGSTTWEARVDLAAAAATRLQRTSPSGAWSLSRAAHDGIADREMSTPGSTGNALLVDYRDPNATERYLGVVVFTPLTPASPQVPFVIGGEGCGISVPIG